MLGPAHAFGDDPVDGREVTYHFCPTCGSTVYWEPRCKPDQVGVALGAFADASFPAPTQQVHREDRHLWVSVPHLDGADDPG